MREKSVIQRSTTLPGMLTGPPNALNWLNGIIVNSPTPGELVSNELTRVARVCGAWRTGKAVGMPPPHRAAARHAHESYRRHSLAGTVETRP